MAQGRTFEHGPRARALFDQGWSCNRIAKELGVSPSTISGWAKREGLSFDRAPVAAANQARTVDGKARRLNIVDRLYGRALKNLDRLDAEQFKTLLREFGGGETVRTLDFVPTQNERDLIQAVSTALASAAKLEAIDADGGAAEGRSMLVEFGRALGIIPKADES